MPLFRLLLAAFFFLAMNIAAAQEFVPVPPLTAHVVDTAGMLNAGQRESLDNVLRDYEAHTGSQIAVLLVPSTAPEAIEQYSIRVADAWKLGRKGVDDGVILVVAKDNPKALRRLRIEAGRGVQGSLTDAQSKRVLEDVIAPHFRQNDFYGGLVAGVSAIQALLDKEHLPQQQQGRPQAAHDAGSSIFPLLFFIFVILTIFSRGRRSRRMLSDNGWGTATGIIIGNSIARNRRGDFGGFGGGGFGGGGGFSGGGGGFDGGGASGDW
jgi:uncharacterized protein